MCPSLSHSSWCSSVSFFMVLLCRLCDTVYIKSSEKEFIHAIFLKSPPRIRWRELLRDYGLVDRPLLSGQTRQTFPDVGLHRWNETCLFGSDQHLFGLHSLKDVFHREGYHHSTLFFYHSRTSSSSSSFFCFVVVSSSSLKKSSSSFD